MLKPPSLQSIWKRQCQLESGGFIQRARGGLEEDTRGRSDIIQLKLILISCT